MNTIKKIGLKFLKVNFLISLNFFYSQCYFYIIIRTKFYNFIYRLKNVFNPINGNIIITNEELSSLLNEFKINQPRLTNQYYIITSIDSMPLFCKRIIEKHKKQIELYLGENFVFEKLTFSLTKKIPDKFLQEEEYYSNFWHQDSDVYKLLKIFILINNVTDYDGPLTFLDLENTKKNWSDLKYRNSLNNIKKIDNEIKFTGKLGDYLILDTSRSLHRAGIPQKYREMLTLTLYPKWSKTADVERFNWNNS